MRVLLVEDDPGLSAIIKTGFAEQGIQVVAVSTYADGLMKASMSSFSTSCFPAEMGSISAAS